MSSQKDVELKGGMYTFMSLKLQTTDISTINEHLANKVKQAPAFFKDTPVVVDVSSMDADDGSSAAIDGTKLIDCIRSHNLLPIVASVSNKSSPLATSIALPLIEGGAQRQGVGEQSVKKPAGNGVNIPGSSTTTNVEYIVKKPMLITRPIRSGQQLYARDTDLIIMGSTGAGAEIVADGNIHVYGPLRGKALCGVSGNTETRIFCQSLEAELVSVAGVFQLLDAIPEHLRGKPAQIWLDKDRLNIEPL